MPETRRHAAIMFTDIVGYAALMGSDEEKAVDMLSRNRSIHQSCIEKFNGTLIKEIGDGILASFSLASDAVRCAIEIQNECKEQSIPLKIGIHEGELIVTGTDILGDTVNIASRLQEDAQEGCINISDTVYKDIKNKTDIKTKFIEEKTLKNIDDPLRIYTIIYDDHSLSKTQLKKSKPKVENVKSIIVLPFVNMSPDPHQEYFSDGLTEEIITDLSEIQNLQVISRNSAMTFKDSGLTSKKIAKKVNVQYVLEGSIRKDGNNLRITAQLIDGTNDAHIWAEKYKGILDDVFEIQENVSRSIVESLKLQLSQKEKQKLAEHSFNNIKAYELYLKANDDIFKFTEEDINRAIRHLEHGLEIIGDNAYLYSGLALSYWNLVNIGVKQDEYILKAENSVQKALKLDPEFSKAHAVLGWINHLGNPYKSVHHLRKALHVNPDDSFSIMGLLVIYTIHVGKIRIAEQLMKKLDRIDPLNPFISVIRGIFYFFNGMYDNALEAWQVYYKVDPDNPYSQFDYALGLSYRNQLSEAIKLFDQCAIKNSDNIIAQLGLVIKYGLLNDKNGMLKLLNPKFIKTCKRDVSFCFNLAGIFANIGAKEESLNWLENAIAKGFINYPVLTKHDPWLENIRNEKRFKVLMKKVKIEWDNFKV